MAEQEVLTLNEATPQIEAPQAGIHYAFPRNQHNAGVIFIADRAAADTDKAGYGQIWVDNLTPDNLRFTDDAGTDFQVATLAGTETLTNKTLTSPVIAAIAADLGVVGTIESADATTPILSTATGKTNTGYLSLTGKTSGSLKILPADAMAQVVTIAPAGQTSGAATLTIPDQAGVNSNFVFDTLAATLTNKTLTAPVINGGDYNGVSMGVTEGSGYTGTATVSSEITKQGKLITTHLFIDIAGLVVSTTENDIIGETGGAANSHAGQFAAAESGQFLSGSVTCLEAPTTGTADIDFTVSSASTGAENVDVGTLADPVILLASAGAWTLGLKKALTLLPDATSDFLYLSNGAGGDPGTYGAGQFLVELIGYEA